MTICGYSDYIDTGSTWMPRVPFHWSRSALKHLAAYQNGYPFKPEDWSDEGLPILRISQLTSDAEPNYFAGIADERVKVTNGDLLFSWSANIDSYIWNGGPAWLNQHIFKVTPSMEVTRDFLYFVIKHVAPKLADVDAHGSTMRHIKKESLGETVYVPPLGEQRAIAAFLNRETAKIDALVAEQERLMALLREKRQAVISHAVTKGLHSNAPLKASGVEWIGTVPAHWGTLPLGRITVSRCDGPFGSGLKSEHYTDEGVRVIRLQNIRAGLFNAGDAAFIDEDYFATQLSGHDVRTGDVLIAGLGDDNNTVGRACVAPEGIEPAMVKADCFRFRLNREKASPEYIALQLSAGAAFDAGNLSSGSTRSRIPLNTMASRVIVLPPLREQLDIVEYIRGLLAELDALHSRVSEAIELLAERRAALISAAVTGQIDVRHLAPADAA